MKRLTQTLACTLALATIICLGSSSAAYGQCGRKCDQSTTGCSRCGPGTNPTQGCIQATTCTCIDVTCDSAGSQAVAMESWLAELKLAAACRSDQSPLAAAPVQELPSAALPVALPTPPLPTPH